MITRPLDLASRLRREPRSNDWMFFVNGGLIVLFFVLFGSPFVLAPSFGLELPEVAGADADARTATHHITVSESGQIFLRAGSIELAKLEAWLKREVDATKAKDATAEPVLWVTMDARVPIRLQTQISSAAYRAGFTHVRIAAREPKADTGGR